MQFILFFIQGSRPATLVAVILPCLMATSLAYSKTGHFDLALFLLTLFSGICIQISCNLFNDALDFKQGVDQKNRLGFKRLTAEGLLPFSVVMKGAYVFAGLACLLAISLIKQAGWPILLLGSFSLLCAYLYSASSLSLSKLGLGELAVVVFFGFGACIGSYYIQTLSWDPSLIYLSLQCGFWSLSLLLINYLRDELEDKQALRKNIITVYGRNLGVLALCLIQLFIYLLCFYWMSLGMTGGAWSFFTIILSSVLLSFVGTSMPSSRYNLYLLFTSLLYVIFSILWIAGCFYD